MARFGSSTQRRAAMVSAAQRGMVLIIVLWMVTMLAVIAGAFSYAMQIETRLATSTVERAQARALVEAGVAYAMAWQLDPEARQQWPATGDVHDWEFGGRALRISVEDANGRISLNQADAQLLRLALTGSGMDEADAESIAGAIVDWRDPDDQSASGGSESAQFRQAGYAGVKNSAFDDPAELQQIPGITPQLAQHLANITTTATIGMTGLNPQLAALPLLATITGLDAATLNDYALQRSQALLEGNPPPPLPENPATPFLAGGIGSNNSGGTYHITVSAPASSGASINAEIIASTQHPPRGQALRWIAWRFLH